MHHPDYHHPGPRGTAPCTALPANTLPQQLGLLRVALTHAINNTTTEDHSNYSRSHVIHQNLCIPLFFITILGPDYYVPPSCFS